MQQYESLRSKVIIIEDNQELRKSYSLLVKSTGNFVVSGEYDDCETALKNLHRDKPELVLIDLNLPGMNGITGITRLKKLDPSLKILVVTVHDDSPHVFDALCAGAIGYITKDASSVELISALEQMEQGGAPMSAKIATMIVRSFHINPETPLTEKETAVLRQLAQGKTYAYIAQFLNISKDTVKTHIRHIYEKLQVDNKSEAVIKAKKDNLV